MGMRTGLIRFNVRERGRRFRGQERNFDTTALAELVNGGEVQERVKNGDLVGYYGHWPRVKFGMEPTEGAVVAGRQVNLEPAIRTVSLRAHPDGTIEHEAEFLDTAPGRLAQRLYQSKTGGFSSAINAPRRGSIQVPTSFHGFDYVIEPNFTTNRGYVLDAAGNRIEPDGMDEESQAVLDEVAQYAEIVQATTAMFDRVQGDYDRLAEVVTDLQAENNELRGMLAKAPKEPEPAKSTPEPTREEVLDSARQMGKKPEHTPFARAEEFMHGKLAAYEPVEEKRTDEPVTAADKYISRRFGR